MTDSCENCGRPRVVKEHGRCLYCGELMPHRPPTGRGPGTSQPTALGLFRQRLLAERQLRVGLVEARRRPMTRVAALLCAGVFIVAAVWAGKGVWGLRPEQVATPAVAHSTVGSATDAGAEKLTRLVAALQEPASAQEALARVGVALELYARRFDRYPDQLSPDLSELGQFGNMKAYLSFFQGNRIQSYRRSFTAERRLDSYLLQAIAGDQDGTLLTAASTFAHQDLTRRVSSQ